MSKQSLPSGIRDVPREFLPCKRGRRHFFPEENIKAHRFRDDRGRLFKLVETCAQCGTLRIGIYFEETRGRAVQADRYIWPEGYRTTDLGRVESEVWLGALLEHIPWSRRDPEEVL